MGSLYYDWATIASDAGLVVKVTATNAGWEQRARSSGGYSARPLGTMWHHAASSSTTSDENCVNYQVRGNPDNPVGNITIGREGDIWPIAGGASNCSGKGGPWPFSRGSCPKDAGNTTLVNFEVNNNGVGGAWSTRCIDSYFTLSNAVNAYLANQPSDVVGHNHYAPDRKIDPATAAAVQGPWRPRSINSSGTWHLEDMKSECARRRAGTAPTPEEPDMTDAQAQQLAELHQYLTQTIGAPGQFTDPGGANLNLPWAAAWNWQYISGPIDSKLNDIIARLERLEH